MDNPETLAAMDTQDRGQSLATLDTQDTRRRQTKHKTIQKTKKMSNMDPHQKLWATQVLAKGKLFLYLIRYVHPPCPCYSYRRYVG